MFYLNHRLTRLSLLVGVLMATLVLGAFSFVSAEDSSSTRMTWSIKPGWLIRIHRGGLKS